MFELGTEAISVDGTLVGTLVYSTIANPYERVWTDYHGSDETTEIGTTTGLDHDVGTTTVDGTVT
jgi:hypothetical protein